MVGAGGQPQKLLSIRSCCSRCSPRTRETRPCAGLGGRTTFGRLWSLSSNWIFSAILAPQIRINGLGLIVRNRDSLPRVIRGRAIAVRRRNVVKAVWIQRRTRRSKKWSTMPHGDWLVEWERVWPSRSTGSVLPIATARPCRLFAAAAAACCHRCDATTRRNSLDHDTILIFTSERAAYRVPASASKQKGIGDISRWAELSSTQAGRRRRCLLTSQIKNRAV